MANDIHFAQLTPDSAEAQKPVVILPDKDADGLSSGTILHHTLTQLGLSPDLIAVYFPPKGSNVHDDVTKEALTEIAPSYVFVLDQGSRRSPALLDLPHKCLIVDHHFAEDGGFPEGAEYVTAHDCPPVATTSLLIYHICLPLHPSLSDKISWLAAMGTHGDLGTTLKWEPPFPDMTATFKRFPKKAINDAVGLVNAPRRSAAYNVRDAWAAVLSASDPSAIKAARSRVRSAPRDRTLHAHGAQILSRRDHLRPHYLVRRADPPRYRDALGGASQVE
jgi:hypothetical protein